MLTCSPKPQRQPSGFVRLDTSLPFRESVLMNSGIMRTLVRSFGPALSVIENYLNMCSFCIWNGLLPHFNELYRQEKTKTTSTPSIDQGSRGALKDQQTVHCNIVDVA